MKTLALIVGKLLAKIGQAFHRGSSLPGKLALKIDPDLISKLTPPSQVIMVTGTNGKTSTTRYLASFFSRAGMEVVSNAEGANMPQGIASTLVRDANLAGRSQSDLAILEVDEGWLGQIAMDYPPDILVLTNLFKDQVDRFGSPALLANEMAPGIPEETELFVNGDDPILVGMAASMPNPKLYYGLSPLREGTGKAETCPNCGQPLFYSHYAYDHLGSFSCSCGFSQPQPDVLAYEEEDGSLDIEGNRYIPPARPLYSAYNCLAAVSVALEEGLDPTTIQNALKNTDDQYGRMEEFRFNAKPSFLNLVKNPAGANASFDYILNMVGNDPFDLYFAANNAPADGRDSSWIKELEFEKFKRTSLRAIFIAGSLTPQLRASLKAKLPSTPIKRGRTETILAELFVRGNQTFFLANFTALPPIRKALVKADILREVKN